MNENGRGWTFLCFHFKLFTLYYMARATGGPGAIATLLFCRTKKILCLLFKECCNLLRCIFCSTTFSPLRYTIANLKTRPERHFPALQRTNKRKVPLRHPPSRLFRERLNLWPPPFWNRCAGPVLVSHSQYIARVLDCDDQLSSQLRSDEVMQIWYSFSVPCHGQALSFVEISSPYYL